jgi:hypothetical protein
MYAVRKNRTNDAVILPIGKLNRFPVARNAAVGLKRDSPYVAFTVKPVLHILANACHRYICHAAASLTA